MKRILFTREDGGVSIVTPSNTWKGTLKDLAKKVVPKGRPWRIIENEDIPEDRFFRDAWCDVTPAKNIDIDLEKARNIQMADLRRQRNKRLEDSDREMMIANEIGDEKKVAKLKKFRQELRDMPDNVNLDDIVDLKELRNTIPEVLRRVD